MSKEIMLKTLQRKTRNDLKFNWKQFIAVWCVVVLGTGFYGAMYPAGVNLLNTINNGYEQLAYLDYHIQLAPSSKRAAEMVRAVSGVSAVEERLIVEGGVQLDPDQDYLTSLRLISLPASESPITLLRLLDETYPKSGVRCDAQYALALY